MDFKWLRLPRRERPPETPKARRLWGKDFAVTTQGLAEDQVVAFVDDLLARYQAAVQHKDSSPSAAFSRQMLAEAERDAATLRARAKRDAEVEAARMLAEARERAQAMVNEGKRRAEEITEKQVQDILLTARRKAELTEAQAKQLAQMLLIRAREEILGQLTAEAKEAYYRLLGPLQELMTASQGVEAEWKSKTLELWSTASLELEQFQTKLLDSFPTGEAAISAAEPTEEPPGQPAETLFPATVEADIPASPDRGGPPPEAPGVPPRDGSQAGQAPARREPVVPDRLDREERARPAGVAEPPARAVRAPEVVASVPKPPAEAVPAPSGASSVPETRAEAVSEAPVEAVPEAPVEAVPETPVEAGPETPTEAAPAGVSGKAPAAAPRPDVYSGEVDLVLSPPVEAARVVGLYTQLQKLQGVKVLRTAGSFEGGTVVTVSLDRPVPLISLLESIPSLKAAPGSSEGGLGKGAAGPGEGGKARSVRIAIAFKSAEATGPAGT